MSVVPWLAAFGFESMNPDRAALREAIEWSIKALGKFADWADDRGIDATLNHPDGKISTALLVRPKVEQTLSTLRAWLASGLSDDERETVGGVERGLRHVASSGAELVGQDVALMLDEFANTLRPIAEGGKE